MPESLRTELVSTTNYLGISLQGYIVSQKLHGQVLNQRSGALARSIQYQLLTSGQVVQGRVYSAGDVKYAAIHEFGGTIHHPGGTAYIPAGGSLGAYFVSNADAAGTNLPRTAPHDIPMPERSFMRSSLADKRQEIEQRYTTAVRTGARKALGQ